MEDTVIVRNKSSIGKKYIAARNIPMEILEDEGLKLLISLLPNNYNFEIHKSIWRIKQENCKVVALQFPEGLLMYSCIIADILVRYTSVQVIILGDVTYGACCIDDYTAAKLGANLLIHYGHSCLVPVNTTKIKIQFDSSHLIETLCKNFNSEKVIVILGTVQFTNVIHSILSQLKNYFPKISVSQAKPLSFGETLGCTSPVLSSDTDLFVFIADGRFHLESAMIQNPSISAFRYDPYAKVLTSEGYAVEEMKNSRWSAILKSRQCQVFGVVLGTLGRQGNGDIFQSIVKTLRTKGKDVVKFLMAEISPIKLKAIVEVDCWVQIACPRLSIDWGREFHRPVLTPYELMVAMDETEWQDEYPMDYYRNNGGKWTNYHIK